MPGSGDSLKPGGGKDSEQEVFLILDVTIQHGDREAVSSQRRCLVPIRSRQEACLELLEHIDLTALEDVDESRRSLRDLDQGDGPGRRKKRKNKAENEEKPEWFHAYFLNRKWEFKEGLSFKGLRSPGMITSLY